MNTKLSLIAGVVITSVSLYSASVYAVQINGTATANVLAPLTLTQTLGMDFGNVAAATGSTSTVVLAPDSTTSVTGGAFSSGTPVAGAFSVTGDDAQSYSINLPATTSLTGGSGPNILVNAFTDSNGGTDGSPSSSTTSGTTDNFTVGATLNLADGQGSGTYSGTYPISIDYQ